ncbi:hypothetical protein D3C71_1930350 [compost metagenome]
MVTGKTLLYPSNFAVFKNEKSPGTLVLPKIKLVGKAFGFFPCIRIGIADPT